MENDDGGIAPRNGLTHIGEIAIEIVARARRASINGDAGKSDLLRVKDENTSK